MACANAGLTVCNGIVFVRPFGALTCEPANEEKAYERQGKRRAEYNDTSCGGEIRELSETLLGVGKNTLINVTPEGGSGAAKRVFRDNSGDNYAVYAVVVSSHYGTVETETLIHIDRNGVIKGIEKLTWSVSPANPEKNYNPPSSEAVDAFYAGLVGKDSESIKGVDLKTGATNTTTNLVNSVTEGIEIVKKLSLGNQ